MMSAEEDIIYCKEYFNQSKSADLLFYRYAFEQESSLSHNYASIKVYVDADFCLIPDKKEFVLKRKHFAQFLLDEDILEHEIYYHPIKPHEVAGLFAPSQVCIDILNEFLPAFELSNSCGLLLYLAKKLSSQTVPVLLVQTLDEYVNILGLKNGQLHFIQRYAYRTELDLVYFIQLTKSILNKDSRVDMYLIGEVEDLDNNLETVKKYFPKIKFPPNLQFRAVNSLSGSPWWKYAYLN